MTTVFEKIINRELPAQIIYENDHVIVIKDIAPAAPIHLLIIAKKVIPSLQVCQKNDLWIISEIMLAAQHVVKMLGITDYRLLTNNGEEAGQSVFHLHFHLLSGKKLERLA